MREEIRGARRSVPRRRPARLWIRIVLDFHATLREALAVKLWLSTRLGSRGDVTPDVVAEFKEWHRRFRHRHGAAGPADGAFLARHRRPPGGRLQILVWEALSKRYGMERRDLERAVFGPLAEDDGP